MNSLSTPSGVEDMPEPASDVGRVKSAGSLLFAAGAIASLTGEPRPILIGDLQWSDGRGLLIFTAYGDGPTDSHLLPFDEAIVNESGSITLLCGGRVTGAIQRIEDADVDDPYDYRIAWQFWQEVAPLYEPLIQRCYDAILSDKEEPVRRSL